ncbi:MAG: glycosyltransferase, partial [Weeksellaceae bacterium]|nr:glycosyltransferase [Weeksellaceae bacterium]
MALPSVVSDINGCNEIIHRQTNGLIVPKKDVDGLGRAMRRMMSDPSARKRMKAAAREMIVSRYEQKQLWEALLTEYKELLKTKS